MVLQERDMYSVYTEAEKLFAVEAGEKIPIFTLELLRQADFPISRGISYERTVDEFLLELLSNIKLHKLKDCTSMAVLLDKEGALVKENGGWRLLFYPVLVEGNALTEQDDLYGILKLHVKAVENGEMCEIALPDRSLKALSAKRSPLCILDEYCKNQEEGYLGVAKKIVKEGTRELFASVPVCKFNNLETVDIEEIESYRTVKNLLDEYIYNYDEKTANGGEKKPISIAVFGTPGSGKSFGVKQIAKGLGRFAINVLNISQYNSIEELFLALDAALHYEDSKIPLVFFDEFDAELNGISRGWLKYFLAPMQDAEYTLNGETKKIPGAVFIFAGATACSFKEFMPADDEEANRTFKNIKGPDFVSRLKGILNIKGPNPVVVTDRKYMIRRAMLLRSQIIMNAKCLYNKETGSIAISDALLSALLRVSVFRHGSRSIEFLLGMSRLSGVKKYTPSCLPVEEQLDIHIDVKDFMSKLTFEQMMGGLVEQYARTVHENYRKKRIEDANRRGFSQEEISRMMQEENMAEWDCLKENYKEDNRSQIRYLGERFEKQNVGIGIRLITEGAPDTISDVYGPILEVLAEAEHERWVQNKLENGWVAGERDNELKHHPDMIPYAQLSETMKDYDRAAIRNIPAYLNSIGYELYRKTM